VVPDLGGRSELDGGRAIPVWPENPDDVNSRAVSARLNLTLPTCPFLHAFINSCPHLSHQPGQASLADCTTCCPCPACLLGLQVWSLMNLAYAHHEIISDYVTAALMWFETGCVGGRPAIGFEQNAPKHKGCAPCQPVDPAGAAAIAPII
jgi:hypothetical protein